MQTLGLRSSMKCASLSGYLDCYKAGRPLNCWPVAQVSDLISRVRALNHYRKSCYFASFLRCRRRTWPDYDPITIYCYP